MSNELWWYLMRAAGLTAWVALTATLVLGAVVSGHMTDRRGARRWILDLHPYLGGVGLAALGLHIVAAVADSAVDIDWIATVVPGTSGWNPAAIALGVLGLWLLVAVEVTSLARRALSRRTWHGIHLLSYGAAWLMALHAAFAGTDVRNPFVAGLGLVLVSSATVVAMLRAWGPGAERRDARGGDGRRAPDPSLPPSSTLAAQTLATPATRPGASSSPVPPTGPADQRAPVGAAPR